MYLKFVYITLPLYITLLLSNISQFSEIVIIDEFHKAYFVFVYRKTWT